MEHTAECTCTFNHDDDIIFCPLHDAAPELLEALESMFNVEGAARIGAESGALRGLDWKYHFDKARDAIKAARKS
ncbi:hypothetical protein LCGC14_2449560 [marine sediment metagenome]|uniref:Uncharacterized protein n=1 Tax=marine sediment metagenome TaxID=412755 RepID=A0A0F9DTL4_9ZZZZ